MANSEQCLQRVMQQYQASTVTNSRHEQMPYEETAAVAIDDISREPFTEIKRRHTEKPKPLIQFDFYTLTALFVVGSIMGLLLEIAYHAVVDGMYENRFGLVWGPFSPLYGVGTVVFSMILNRFWHRSGIFIFVASAIMGSSIEFACSWWMEYFFGAVSWDYSGTFLNIEGRINLMFSLFWGALGFTWARFALPLLKHLTAMKILRGMAWKTSITILAVFMAINIVVTVQALERESSRLEGIAAASAYDVFFDEHFSSEWLATRFENMNMHETQQVLEDLGFAKNEVLPLSPTCEEKGAGNDLPTGSLQPVISRATLLNIPSLAYIPS